jgi:hypothetical protein
LLGADPDLHSWSRAVVVERKKRKKRKTEERKTRRRETGPTSLAREKEKVPLDHFLICHQIIVQV